MSTALHLSEELQERYLRDPFIQKALTLHRNCELSYVEALELAVVNLSAERERLFREAVRSAEEEAPAYFWPEGGEPKRIPPFPDAWRCRTCRWWESMPGPSGRGRGACLHLTKIQAKHEEGWPPAVMVDPDFGCIQWQARDGE